MASFRAPPLSWSEGDGSREGTGMIEMLAAARFIPLPGRSPTQFDHGAFDAATGRIFVAHTAADSVEVIDARDGRHARTLPGHVEAAGVVAGEGRVAVTNRGAASLSLIDAATLDCLATFATSMRPNGVALASRRGVALAACVGSEATPPALDRIDLRTGERRSIALPGRPRWCMVDATEERLYCAIREPSSILVVGIDPFEQRAPWPLPSGGAHGLDIDPTGGRLYVACDEGALIALATDTGAVLGRWPLPGAPDATFFNPATGRVHVAIGDPGVIVSVEPSSGAQAVYSTEAGAKTTALATPDRLFVFLPQRGGALELRERPA
jgi:DNA-binding beta-propeller fold protein YncE